MGVDRAGFWVLAAREGKSGDYATTPCPSYMSVQTITTPGPSLPRRGILQPPLPLLVRREFCPCGRNCKHPFEFCRIYNLAKPNTLPLVP
jgi:hypothetical protein